MTKCRNNIKYNHNNCVKLRIINPMKGENFIAMISCPECGEQISDKSKKCVHCCYVFAEEPVEKTKEESTQQVELTKVNTKPKVNMRQIIIAIVAAVVISTPGLMEIL